MKLTAFLSLAAAVLIALPASASDMADSNLIIPVAARTAGAYGTQWRTDLVITNLGSDPVNLFVTLHSGPTSGSFTSQLIGGHATLVLEDVLSTLFFVDSGLGILRVNSPMPGARLTARAYVYNRGMAGEFGQGIAAVPVDALRQEHVLSGLAAGPGRRTNVGVANPWSTEADVVLVLHSPAGAIVGQHAMTLTPGTVVQLSDIWSLFGVAPISGASIRVLSSIGVHPYASIVRNDTGDAVFVAGSGVGRIPEVLAAQCSEPAPLIHPWGGEAASVETTIEFHPGTMPQYMDGLAAQRGFTIEARFDGVPAIIATLTPQQIAAVRCDPAVKLVRRDGAVSEP